MEDDGKKQKNGAMSDEDELELRAKGVRPKLNMCDVQYATMGDGRWFMVVQCTCGKIATEHVCFDCMDEKAKNAVVRVLESEAGRSITSDAHVLATDVRHLVARASIISFCIGAVLSWFLFGMLAR